MRFIIIIIFQLIFCVLPHFSLGQTWKATYTYQQESTNFKEEYTLLFNDTLAQYIHEHKFTTTENDKGWEFYFKHDYYNWYYNKTNSTITERRLLEEGLPVHASYNHKLEWEFSEETKIINGYTCYKATTLAYDLDPKSEMAYGKAIAWYAPEIPYPYGPERYFGLPGLIVQLEFSNRSFICQLQSLKKISEIATIPNLDNGSKEVTKREVIWPTLLKNSWINKQLGK